jgi:hypothetical protein
MATTIARMLVSFGLYGFIERLWVSLNDCGLRTLTHDLGEATVAFQQLTVDPLPP